MRAAIILIVGMAAAAVAFGAYWLFIRPKHLRWGATDEEVREKLPGDEFVPPQPFLRRSRFSSKALPWHIKKVKAPAATVAIRTVNAAV